MKFLYIANMRLPSEKAHPVQVMKTCEAMNDAGALAALIVPNRRTPIADDPFSYYDIKTKFPLQRIGTLDTVSWGFFGFVLQTLTFAISARRILRHYSDSIIYGRDEAVLWMLSLFNSRQIIWESHTGSWNFFARKMCARSLRLVVITNGLKEFYISKGVAEKKIIVAPDAIDARDFENPESKAEARARLEFPSELSDSFIALYVGRVDSWKGVDTLLAASSKLPESIRVVIIGGEPDQLIPLKKKFPNVFFAGFHPYRELSNNLAAGDVLILPTSSREDIGARYTSPLKLFAYLAAGKPIIASDVPSSWEVLTETNARFVPADDPNALAKAIIELQSAPDRMASMQTAALELSKQYTWQARAENIIQNSTQSL